MSDSPKQPGFSDFTRWLASLSKPAVEKHPNEMTVNAARAARDSFLASWKVPQAATPRQSAEASHVEKLYLLAAADSETNGPPREMTSPRGLRIMFDYQEGSSSRSASICVLVECPSDRVQQFQGKAVSLWYGTERFELGVFDSDGKAIGTLPAGITITAQDFESGAVKLEGPGESAED
jgi:hypothetical protein